MTPVKRGGILTSRGYDFSYFQFWWWGGASSGAPDPTLPKPYSLENERLLILLSVWTSVTEISASWLTQPELETADSTVSSLRPRHRMRHRIDFVQPWSVSASGQDGGGKRPFSIWNQHVFFFPLPLCSFFAIFSEFTSLISWWECRFNDIYFGKHALLKFWSNVSRLILKLAAETNTVLV